MIFARAASWILTSNSFCIDDSLNVCQCNAPVYCKNRGLHINALQKWGNLKKTGALHPIWLANTRMQKVLFSRANYLESMGLQGEDINWNGLTTCLKAASSRSLSLCSNEKSSLSLSLESEEEVEWLDTVPSLSIRSWLPALFAPREPSLHRGGAHLSKVDDEDQHHGICSLDTKMPFWWILCPECKGVKVQSKICTQSVSW